MYSQHGFPLPISDTAKRIRDKVHSATEACCMSCRLSSKPKWFVHQGMATGTSKRRY